MKNVQIGSKTVGVGHPTFVIAEIGINHNGDIALAKKLIDLAVSAGSDAVKFQKRTVDVVFDKVTLDTKREVPRDLLEKAITRGVLPGENVARLKASNFTETTNGDQKYALELSKEEYTDIDSYCKEKGIMWFASPWDEGAVDFLAEFNVPAYKVASASLTDDGLLRHMRLKGKPILLSTGLSDMAMVHHAVEVLGQDNLVIMQCTGVYPKTDSSRTLEMVNLNVIKTYQKEFPEVPIGFSSNDTGIVPTFASVAMGAVMIEKHITLERSMWGSDQASSVEPGPYTTLCRWIRDFQSTLGDGVKVMYPEEVEVAKKLRRK
jgi:N-acetylneuraminate synthase